MKVEKILLTTDLSEQSFAAFSHAVDIAKHWGGEILLLHVFEAGYPLPTPGYGSLPEISVEWKAQYKSSIDQQLKELAADKLQGVKVRTMSIEPCLSSGDEIAQMSIEENCDLIIMSSSGRRRLSRLILGSTVQRVLSRVKIPVLIIPLARD